MGKKKKSKLMASAFKPAVSAPSKRGRRFYEFVRLSIVAGLTRVVGVELSLAKAIADSLTDGEIDTQADVLGIGAVSDTGFFARLIAVMPEIIKIVKFFVAVFGGTLNDTDTVVGENAAVHATMSAARKKK